MVSAFITSVLIKYYNKGKVGSTYRKRSKCPGERCMNRPWFPTNQKKVSYSVKTVGQSGSSLSLTQVAFILIIS